MLVRSHGVGPRSEETGMLRRFLVALLVGVLGVAVSVVPAQAISGGAAVNPDWVRFVVKIDIGGENPRACTGALVDPQWVMTAASCFAEGPDGTITPGAPAAPTTATVGRADLTATTGQQIPVDRVVPHPERDVALVRLALVATSGTPVAVGADAPTDTEALALAGFGRTADTWVPDEVQAAAVSVTAIAEATFDVAGAPDAPVAACQGDAGGTVTRQTDAGVELAGLLIGSPQDGCLEEPAGSGSGATVVRLDGLAGWIESTAVGYRDGFQRTYHSVAEPDGSGQQTGIGGFDFHRANDQVVAFDFDRSGKQDHLLMYRPGSNIVIISRLDAGDPRDPADDRYVEVFRSTQGIGGVALTSSADRMVPFDYDHDGFMDDLAIYRPGTERRLTIVTHGEGTSFTTAYTTVWTLLQSTDAQVLAYDFDRDGAMDDLLAYRPAANQIAVVTKGTGAGFVDKVAPATGVLPGYTMSAADRVIAFDYDHTGKADDLFVYRPGSAQQQLHVFTRGTGNTFTKAYATYWWMFQWANTHAIAYDYDHDGRSDDVLAYRAGQDGHYSIISKGPAAGFEDKVSITAGGIGGYDLRVATDRIVAFDAEHIGSRTNLLTHRPGTGIAWVMDRADPPLGSTTPVQHPRGETSTVEEFAYPGATRILDELGVELVSGDGHIVIDETCGTQPDENGIGLIKVRTTENIGVIHQGVPTVCFKVLGSTGRLDLMIPAVYEIRGDGYQPGTGHEGTAVIDTASAPPVEVELNPDGYTPVGIGADPENEPTMLLQLRVTQ